MRSSVERRKLQRFVACHIKSSTNLLRRLLKESCWTSQLACNVCPRKIKNTLLTRIGSSRAYKRSMAAGKEFLNFEDPQESCNQLFNMVRSWRLYNIYYQQEEVLKPKTVKDHRSLRLQ